VWKKLKGISEKEIDELKTVILKRGMRVNERFKQEAVKGLSHPELLLVFKDITTRWKDMYRPALTSVCCEAVGGHEEKADTAGLMITLVSAGGGLHDDIVDKSLNKHFRRTFLGLHGLEDSLVVGDLLILRGWATLKNLFNENLKPVEIVNIIEAFSNWTVEISESEFKEIRGRRNLDTELVDCQKTLWMSMADTEACARIGAIIGGGSTVEIQALAEFGRRLGFTFRLLDDLKDTFNLEGNLPVRLEFESVPLPILYAAKTSKTRYSEIKSILDNPPATPSDIGKLLGYCLETKAIAFVHNLSKQNWREAEKQLNLIKRGKARNILEMMIKMPLADTIKLCS
jgi:geranylgeranyl pyrophosphate synthase